MLYLCNMKDKRIYFIHGPQSELIVVKVPFQLLWEASRESLDVPNSEKIDVMMECLERGNFKGFIVASILYQLCDYDKQPKEDELFFSNPLTQKILN